MEPRSKGVKACKLNLIESSLGRKGGVHMAGERHIGLFGCCDLRFLKGMMIM